MDSQAYTEAKKLTSDRIHSLTVDVLEHLSGMWFDIYDSEIVEANILLLEQHVKSLYKDITTETVNRRDAIQLDVKCLLKEASDLKRLLKVDCDLSHREGVVPLHTFKSELNQSLEALRTQLKERHDVIEDLLVQQNDICTDLGEPAKPLVYDPLPSAGELEDFRSHLRSLYETKEQRMDEFRELRHEVRQCLEVLELEQLTSEDQKLVEAKKVQYSKANLIRLHQLRDSLNGKCADLRVMIDQTKEKVRNLWKCLETPPEDRDKLEYYREYHRTAFDMWRQEFDRCETEKRQNLKKFVDKIRKELLIMWEKTLKSDEEKRRFRYFTSDVYSDDLIRIHEIELEELNQFYNDNENIFTLVAERKLQWQRMEALEEKANAPNRYNNRGGQLLREEKERKTIAHKLPKIESELRELVQEFEKNNNRKFTVYGEDVVEMIEQEWERKRAGKQKLQTARKKEPIQLTPGRKVNTPHPSRTINSSTATMRAVPNTTSISTALKRKMAPTAGRDGLAPAKRNILGDLNSPRPNKSLVKSKLKTIAAIHTAAKRRSSGRMKQKRQAGQPQQPSEPNSHTSVSYDVFEEFISSTPAHCRSSEVHHTTVRDAVTRLRTPSRIAKSASKYAEVTPLRQKPTRTLLRRLSETADLTTPVRGTLRLATTPGPSMASTTHGNISRLSPRNKLSTKELPIIF